MRSLRRFSRRLGQNFLRDPKVASRIVDSAQLGSGDVVLEPGAGTGALTSLIRKKAVRVIAVEKDPKLAAILREIIGNNPGVTIIASNHLYSIQRRNVKTARLVHQAGMFHFGSNTSGAEAVCWAQETWRRSKAASFRWANTGIERSSDQ